MPRQSQFRAARWNSIGQSSEYNTRQISCGEAPCWSGSKGNANFYYHSCRFGSCLRPVRSVVVVTPSTEDEALTSTSSSSPHIVESADVLQDRGTIQSNAPDKNRGLFVCFACEWFEASHIVPQFPWNQISGSHPEKGLLLDGRTE